MQNRIKNILDHHVFIYDENNDKLYPEGVNKAAEAIVKLVQNQPVDRVRAMATLTIQPTAPKNSARIIKRTYDVPGGDGMIYRVVFAHPRQTRGVQIACRETKSGKVCPPDCDHIKAVMIHLEVEQ